MPGAPELGRLVPSELLCGCGPAASGAASGDLGKFGHENVPWVSKIAEVSA
jgi:hypothetical protein